MLSDFKAFIAKGNVMDLAVGVIIGAAFGAIVKSLTDEIIMPIIGAIFGSIDFSDRYLVLSGEVAPGTTLAAAREGRSGAPRRLFRELKAVVEREHGEGATGGAALLE